MIQKVERDICLLYKQLAEYTYIMGDLYYGDVFNLPYWDYLNLDLPDSEREDFVRDGCLVMILAMAWEFIDGAGNYIQFRFSACHNAVSKIIILDEKMDKLVRTVKLALETVEQEAAESDELIELSSWVHKVYVEGYFRETVFNLDTNYKQKNPKIVK